MLTPRWYQSESNDAVFSFFANNPTGNPVVGMPTASGKSLAIAELIRIIFAHWPSQRIILATHVKELIEQNVEAMREQWPNAPIGINSDGLGERSTNHPIIVGGVASMFRNPKQFGHRDLFIIDEAHLLSPEDDTMYKKLIQGLLEINPYMRLIGYTATYFRLKQGLITQGGLFTHICYDVTRYDQFNRLIDEGYLSPLYPRPTKNEYDISKVGITAGEFNKGDLAEAVDVDKTTYAACQEMAEYGYDRKSWLIFASSIKHAEKIANYMQSLGIDIVALHSKLKHEQCNSIIKSFRQFKIRGVVNFGKLTTGFNHPAIDFIGMLRFTMSPSLWVQMLGRGMRPCPQTGKENCLCLDFARNTLRLGPVNDPMMPRAKKKGDPGVAPVRICPDCGVYNHARALICMACGCVFPVNEKIVKTAGTEELIKRSFGPKVDDQPPITGVFKVENVFYNRYQRPNSPAMMKVTYVCQGLASYSDYVGFQHPGKGGEKARAWWLDHMGNPISPPNADEALKFIGHLRKPIAIEVVTNRKYPEIKRVFYQ